MPIPAAHSICRLLIHSVLMMSMICKATVYAHGSGNGQLPIEVLQNVENIASYGLSFDGRFAAVVTLVPRVGHVASGLDFGFSGLRGRLRVIDVATQASIDLEPKDGDIRAASWSPDGQRLAYVAGTEDDARLWVWSRATRKAASVSELVPRTLPRTLSSKPIWRNDHEIIMSVLPEHFSSETLKAKITAGRMIQQESSINAIRGHAKPEVYSYPDAPTAQSEYATLALYDGDLAAIDLVAGVNRRIVRGRRPVSYSVSPDGTKIAFVDVRTTADGNGYRVLTNIAVTDIRSGMTKDMVRDVVQPTGVPIDPSWSPDGRSVLFFRGGGGAQSGFAWGDVRTGLVAYAGGRINDALRVPLVASGSISSPVWLSNDEAIVLVKSAGSHLVWRLRKQHQQLESSPLPLVDEHDVAGLLGNLGHLDHVARDVLVRTLDMATKKQGFGVLDTIKQKLRILYEEDASYDDQASISHDGSTMLYSETRSDVPQQVWLADSNGAHRRQLTALNAALDSFHFGKATLIRWSNPDGGTMEGALLLPSDYDAAKKYPLILDIYGGSKDSGAYLNSFGLCGNDQYCPASSNMQLFATRGYAVLHADSEARIGSPMTDIAQSVLSGVNKAIEAGIADADRIGIMGHSYGGYSVLSVIVQTQRFKAAVVSAGTANLIDSYSYLSPDGTDQYIGWVEEYQGRMGGSLWDYKERYILNSPIFFLDRVTTPVLLIHGTADAQVPIREGDETYLSLRRLGKEVQYVRYVGEGHNIEGSDDVQDKQERIFSWFNKYLGPGVGVN